MGDLSIIIPTKDRGDIFFNTLQHVINASSHIDAEIIVVNNSNTPVQIPGKPANVNAYDNPGDKKSVFSSRNYGATISRNPILLYIDDDIIVTKESIDYAIKFHREHQNSCFNVNWKYPPELYAKMQKDIFGRFLIKTGFTAMKSLYGDTNWDDNAPFVSRHLASFFFCILKEDFVKIGGYNEKHLHEGTDVDISDRLAANGITIWINPLIMVYHNEADRVDLMNWMERKKRFGEISRNAVNMGDKSHALYYSPLKSFAFMMIYAMQPLFLLKLKVLNFIKADSLGFFIINALLGANICKGYNGFK